MVHIKNLFRLGFVFILTATMFGFASQEAGKPSKLELQKQLEKEFVAPCCWSEAVATHRSEAATQVRSEISELLDQGKSPEEIKVILVAKYSERILIKPSAEGFNLLAWVGPFIFLAVGFVVVGVWLYRNRPGGNAADVTIPDEDI